jgi:NAD(P)H-flavin reductase
MTGLSDTSTAAVTTPGAIPPWDYARATIAGMHDEAPGVQTYSLEVHPPHRQQLLASKPGQFNMLYLPGIGEAAISIASQPDAEPLLHTVRAVGNVTQRLAALPLGAEILIRGPYGRPWPLEDLAGTDLIIAAGGVGLASVRAAISQAAASRDRFSSVAVLIGAKTPDDLLYQHEFAHWQATGLEVALIVDTAASGWQGPVGFVPQLLDNQPISETTTILTCGPEVMMRSLADAAFTRGLSAERFYLSMERNMQCAAGFCGLCQFGPAFVCRNGPVFRYDQIAHFLEVPHL